MTKFLVAFIILLGAGGLFIYMQSTQSAPEEIQYQNPFGEGSDVVGNLDDNGGERPEGESDDDDDTPSAGDSTTGGSGGGGTTSASGSITRATLAQHNKQGDCWVAYKGIVYDITNWLPRHPGSAGAIAPYCGTADEFAAAFGQQHGASKDARLQKEGVKEGALAN